MITTIYRAPARSTSRRIVLDGIVGALVATAAIEAYAAIGRAAGVPMRAAAPGSDAASSITAGSFASGVLICSFWGTLLALLIARFARRPARTFAGATILARGVRGYGNRTARALLPHHDPGQVGAGSGIGWPRCGPRPASGPPTSATTAATVSTKERTRSV